MSQGLINMQAGLYDAINDPPHSRACMLRGTAAASIDCRHVP